MAITCYFSGRLGNIFFALANMIAYAKKHGLQYYVPTEADAYKGFTHGANKVPSLFAIASTGEKPFSDLRNAPVTYREPNMATGIPSYHEIPKMDYPVMLDGYFQSFKYFDWCRDYILQTLNIPYKMEKGIVSISVRRGDCVGNEAHFPIAPKSYYHQAISYMQERGYNLFRVHSDDQAWCRGEFTPDNYNGAIFQFSEGNEVDDFISVSNCEHQVTARSTFSLSAAWLNQNPDKIVLVPTLKNKWWNAQNKDILTDTGFIEIDFDDPDNVLK